MKTPSVGTAEQERKLVELSADILALTSEAAVLIRRGRIAYANPSAQAILGQDCTGKTVAAIFGADIAGAQAPSFIASATIGEKPFIVRVSRMNEGNVIFFTRPEPVPAILNDPFLCSMRSGLMNIGMSSERLREQAEAHGDNAALTALSSLMRSYFRLVRVTANASLVLAMSGDGFAFCPCRLNLSNFLITMTEAVEDLIPYPAVTVNHGEDICLAADPTLIRQLLLNLISNCLVHAEGCSRISISLTDAGENVILSVSDDGKGIEPEQLPTVFDRYRHSFEPSRMGAGPGLGLMVVRGIAEKHGGTLLLESRPGQGTTVRVSLGKHLSADAELRSPGMFSCLREVLVGLSDKLPAECYTEKYMD